MLVIAENIREVKAHIRFHFPQLSGSRRDFVGMGSLIVCPSEEIRYTLPVRSIVSRLEIMDGVLGLPNREVTE